jgi:hypothetical protein
VVGVGNEIARYKAMHESKHSVLNRADGVEMSAMTNSMLGGVYRMWEVGAHDPEKNKRQIK